MGCSGVETCGVGPQREAPGGDDDDDDDNDDDE